MVNLYKPFLTQLNVSTCPKSWNGVTYMEMDIYVCAQC